MSGTEVVIWIDNGNLIRGAKMKTMGTAGINDNIEKSQFGLLTTRRFRPFFFTQFFGVFNDNLYKNALVIMITFQAVNASRMNTDIMINIATGLLTLPIFLFSATAGQLADKYEKARLIRRIKIAEIIIMGCACIAFLLNNITGLLVLLFFMGMQTAFFGPVKYSILPQHLKSGEIVGGNAMVGMGTFLAILLGTMAGGLLCQINKSYITGLAVFVIAFAGWLFSRSIPRATPSTPKLKVNWNIITQTWKMIEYAKADRSIFLSILAVSWFWFIGASYLTQVPNFTKEILKGSEIIITFLLTLFSIGIGSGSLLCERMSGKKIELGLVPLGAIGLSIFGIDLFFASSTPFVTNITGIKQFFSAPGSIRIIMDLLLIGVFGGFYIIPLNSFIQVRAKKEFRARIIATSGMMNALFMVVASLLGVLFIGILKFSIPEFFLIIAIINTVVSIYIFSVIPEFMMRFLIWILSHTFYSIKHINIDNIPENGPAVLVANHVTYVDGLIIGGACRRPVRFVMAAPIYRMPVINLICRTGKAIPITGKNLNSSTYLTAFEKIKKALDEGELVCIFPEGLLTPDGEVHEFKRGVEKILTDTPVPVVPMALRGLWGSFFSKKDNKAMRRLPRGFRSKIELLAGEPMGPDSVTAEKLEETVKNLRGNNP